MVEVHFPQVCLYVMYVPNLQRGESRLQVLLLSRGQDDIGALLCKAACNAQADPMNFGA